MQVALDACNNGMFVDWARPENNINFIFISINYYFVLIFLEYLNLGAINLCARFYMDTTLIFYSLHRK